jgi:hypothetical protein
MWVAARGLGRQGEEMAEHYDWVSVTCVYSVNERSDHSLLQDSEVLDASKGECS